MKWNRIAPVAVAVALLGCAEGDVVEGEEVIDPRIVNGELYAFEGGIGYLGCDGEYFCTGSLVGSQTVLTAAHCVDYKGVTPAVCGEFEFYAMHPGESHYRGHAVARYHVHPEWDDSTSNVAYANDVAVLQLEEAVDVPTIALANAAPSKGASLEIIGFGLTGSGQNGTGGVKRMAESVVDKVDDKTVQFDLDDGGSICNGDSGGPAFAWIGGKRRQVAIHSSGEGCKARAWGVRVDRYLDWIRSVADGDLGCGGVDFAGYCDDATMVWCDDERLQYFDCSTQTEANECGWGVYGSMCVTGDDGVDEPAPGEPLPPDGGDPCGGLTYHGRCDGPTLTWCEGGALQTFDCNGAGLPCGWQDDLVGNNCIASASPCGGVDYHGRCDGATLTWCEGGGLKTYDCATAGMTCGWQDASVGHNCL